MHATSTPSSPHRARWAAIGAAVAVSLGAGGFGLVKAVSPEGASAYVPITPCRLVDTRPGAGAVGPQAGPVPADTAITVEGWGDVAGDCVLPGDATGLQLNVTAVDATASTFLTLYPQGATRPTASNVNVSGPEATPNAATVTLNAANGQFHVYNRFGTVNVIIDVAGYFAAHMHDGADIIDETLTGADVTDESLAGADVQDETLTGADIDDGSVMSVDTGNEPGISRDESDGDDLTTTASLQASVAIQPPTSGYVTVNATFDWFAADGQLNCQITDGTTTIGAGPRLRDSVATPSLAQSVSLQRTFAVEAYAGLIFSGQNFNLVCRKTSGTGSTSNVSMTATFFPTEYEPFNFIFVPIGLSEQSEPGDE